MQELKTGAVWHDLKNRTVAKLPAALIYSVKITVAGLDQTGLWKTAVGFTMQGMYDLKARTVWRNSKNTTLTPARKSRAVKIAVAGLDQTGSGQAAVIRPALEGMEELEA